MADPVSATFIALAAVSATTSVIGGISANNAAKREAALQQEQGRLAQEEANREAARHAQDVRRFSRTQSLAFLRNGVTLAGSPLLVAEDTLTQGQEEVNSIVESGNAQRTLYNQRASATRNSGRAALVGGIGQAAGTVASSYAVGRSAGLFNRTSSTGDFSSSFARDTMLSRS